MKNILFVFAFLCLSGGLFAQTFLQSTTTVNSCTGTYFDSGGSAGDYTSNENSVFTVCSNASNCVSVTFTAFDLETGFDELEIFDGPNTGSPLIGTFSGTVSPGTISSTTGCLTFRFTSDGSVVRSGWAATLSCAPCVIPPCLPNMSNCTATTCSGDFFDSGGSAGNYAINENFTTTICSSNPGQCVSVNFTSFATEAGFDELEIFDGPNTGSTLIGVFSGTNSPGLVNSSTGCLTFRFTSDGSVTSTGWTSTISCGACVIPSCLPNMSNCTATTCTGDFFDSGGSAGNYAINENFTTTICSSNPGQCVSVNFTSFATEAGFDELEIFDGATTGAPLIGIFSGTNSPGLVNSSTGCLTFRFTSDGSVTSTGWTSTISCGACVVPTCLPNMSNCTTNACTGDFFDSGGSAANYGLNENLTTTICSGIPGQCVSVNFTSFSTESGFDELEIFDGATTAAPLIGVFSGTGSPGLVASTTGCLTFRFTSDGSVTSTGWTSTISCAACIVPPSGCATLPDSCLDACNLGSLPNHVACNGSATEGQGTAVLFGGLTNVGAIPQNPYTSIIGCQGVGDMSAPANDVWYQFVVNSPSLQVELFNSGLDSASIGLWESAGSCNNLTPRGCGTSANGNITTQFDLLTPGTTYYLQVSGGATAPNTGNFDLRLTGFEDCAQCIRAAALTVNPLPVNGEYPPNTCVTFTFNITDWNFTLANWIHGVIPTFGVGWNLATLVPTSPPSCDLDGNWGFYNSCTSSATNQVFGPGFYYDSNAGGPLDGNPGNNFGDFCACCWTFSWVVCTSPTCVPGEDLSVTINTTGDGESGSWSSISCTSDPIFFSATATCALPVEWLSFTGQTETVGNRLYWSTAQESNANFYEVERSLDGENWDEVGQTPANGTTSTQSDYEFLDPFPYGEKIFYRLRQFDFDGNFGESEVVVLTREAGWQTNIGQVYPNPVQSKLNLDLTFAENGDYLVQITDLRGKVILEKALDAQKGYLKDAIDVSDLAVGAYFVRLSDKGGQQFTARFVKN